MTLTITLQPIADDRAEARVGEQVVGTFDPRTLLAEHPLHDARYVAPDTYGLRLLAALGGPALQERMIQLPRAPHPESAVIFQVSAPELAAIPWEYLHNGTTFVAFEHFLLREVPVPPGMLPPPPDSALPWRLVVMASDPLLQEVRDEKGFLKGYAPLPRLRVASELDTLRDNLRAQDPPPPLRWHRIAPARDALINLASPDPILFHYTGHGSVRDGQPILCFDDGAGTMKSQPVGDLAVDLRGRTYFAFLNACRTADSAEPAANLALTLVQNGVPAVLGTQASIRDDGAALFAETFYQQLIAGIPMEEALWRARTRLHNSFTSDLTLWGIPAFYRAVGYRLPRQGYAGPPPPAIEPPAPLTSSLQAPARLLGRTIELTEIMRLFVFQHRQIVTIRGPGGMGKTALVHELAARLRFHFRDGIIAVTLALSGEQVSLSAAGLRADLARRMGLQHPAFDDPAASNAQEEAIIAAVQGRRALLIFDNYETVLGALGRDQEKDARLSEPEDVARRAEADAVQRLVTRLARAGVALLFTTRQAPVDLPEEYCYPEAAQGEQLTGLDNVSAIALFRQRAGSRKHSEALPGQVSHAVAGSPLAIQLAAARWGNGHQTEDEFLANLDAELLKAEQSGVPFHQRSVQVNVGLSIDALSAELRQALYEISVVANPVISPLHAAVVWGLEDEKEWFSDQAHKRLEFLQDRSLLQGVGERDTERNWPQAYAFQPVIAQVVRSRAEASDLSAARERYGIWAAGRISRAYGDKGIRYDPEVARSTQFYLPDLIAALPYRLEERRGWDAWRLATILRQFGRVVEATYAIDLAAQMAQKTEDRKLTQRHLVEAAAQAVQRGDLSQARDHYQAALPLMEGEDDRQERSATLHAMAGVLVTRGDLAGAMGLYEQS
ncbi:MAG: CHAT domain-containing protein, partial [Chloroflexales bacterium]